MTPGLKDKIQEMGTQEHPRRRFRAIGAGVLASLVLLTGCGGPKLANADSAPKSPPVATATQTPGPSESAPSQTPVETAPSSEVHKTDLNDSEIYQGMTQADKDIVDKAMNMSLEDFEHESTRDRAMAGLVIMDTNSAGYLEKAKKLVVPGQSDPLGKTYVPYKGKNEDIATDLYKEAISSSPDDVIASGSSAPYDQRQFANAIAMDIAAKGNVDDATKILLGLTYPEMGKDAEDANTGLAAEIASLQQAADNKSVSDPYLNFPLAIGISHTPTTKGSKWVTVGFGNIDERTNTVVPGTDSKGATACTYLWTEFDVNGKHYTAWQEGPCTDRPGGFPGSVPNNP